MHAIVVADGASSRASDDMMTALETDATRAAKTIGFASIRLESLPDQRLDTVPFIDLTESPVDIVEVLTMPVDRATQSSGYVDLEPLASAHGIPVRRNANINTPEEVEHLRQLAPDVLVAVGWTRLLGAEVLDIPPRGCIGFPTRPSCPVSTAVPR